MGLNAMGKLVADIIVGTLQMQASSIVTARAE